MQSAVVKNLEKLIDAMRHHGGAGMQKGVGQSFPMVNSQLHLPSDYATRYWLL